MFPQQPTQYRRFIDILENKNVYKMKNAIFMCVWDASGEGWVILGKVLFYI